MGEHFYGGGDGKWTRRWNTIGPWGYRIDPEDIWKIVVELKNNNAVEKIVNIVVRFQVIPTASEEGNHYRGVEAVWLDLTGCSHAGFNVKIETGIFGYRIPDWKSPIEGVMVDVRGRMHDGGPNMTAYRNNDPICTSMQL